MEAVVLIKQTHEGFCSFRYSHLKNHRFRARNSIAVGAGKLNQSPNSFLNRKIKQVSTKSESFLELNTQRNFEEFENNNHLRRLIRKSELEEGFKYLEKMVYAGDIPDIIPYTSLIRGFCRTGKTRKTTRVMEILEQSGAVPDVITYNVLISGYCRAGEIDKALNVFDRMSVAPDVVTYNTILRSLCDISVL